MGIVVTKIYVLEALDYLLISMGQTPSAYKETRMNPMVSHNPISRPNVNGSTTSGPAHTTNPPLLSIYLIMTSKQVLHLGLPPYSHTQTIMCLPFSISFGIATVIQLPLSSMP